MLRKFKFFILVFLCSRSQLLRQGVAKKMAETLRHICSYRNGTPEEVYDLMRESQGLPEYLIDEIKQEVDRLGGPYTEACLAFRPDLRKLCEKKASDA